MRYVSNQTVVAACSKRLAGLEKYLGASRTPIPANGKMLKPSALAALYRECLDARTAVVAAQAALKAALARRGASDMGRHKADDALRSYVLHRFGEDSPEAVEFGYSARKAPEVRVDIKARAVLLNKATRVARNTLGPKKKLGIKGKLPPPPEASPDASNAASSPAP